MAVIDFPQAEVTDPNEQTYPTGWLGEATFAQIHDDLIPNMGRLLRYYRKPTTYIPDLLQSAFMRLWQDMVAEPTLLADATKGDALRLVLNRVRTPYFIRRLSQREVYLEELAERSGEPDAFIIEGFEGRYYKDHAEFARAVDIRIDFEQVIAQMAEKYADSQPHLAALYYITTDVSLKEAAALAGRSGSKQAWWQTSIVKPRREELAELLQMFVPTRLNWKKKFIGGNREPFEKLVEYHRQDEGSAMYQVLYGMGEHETC
jgi:DNA-directed RNA polymerase specialized sigma24 family protein